MNHMDVKPPYYAVIFTARFSADLAGYEEEANKIAELVKQQPGFIAVDNYIQGDREITISYWKDLDSIKAWKSHPLHQSAQEHGKNQWYKDYQVQIAKVEKQYIKTKTD